MAETAKDPAQRPPVEAVPDPTGSGGGEPGSHESGAHEPGAESKPGEEHRVRCDVAWCPICLSVTAVQPLAPEVVEHLLLGARELFLAFRAVVNQRADDVSGDHAGGTRLEHIDIE